MGKNKLAWANLNLAGWMDGTGAVAALVEDLRSLAFLMHYCFHQHYTTFQFCLLAWFGLADILSCAMLKLGYILAISRTLLSAHLTKAFLLGLTSSFSFPCASTRVGIFNITVWKKAKGHFISKSLAYFQLFPKSSCCEKMEVWVGWILDSTPFLVSGSSFWDIRIGDPNNSVSRELGFSFFHCFPFVYPLDPSKIYFWAPLKKKKRKSLGGDLENLILPYFPQINIHTKYMPTWSP